MSRDIAPFGLRMPSELKESIEATAKANGRSMNAEIINRLEQSLAAEEKAKAFKDGDPLKSMLTVVEGMSQGLTAMASLITQAGIDSGKIKVKDKGSKE
ncbi:MAG: Arc family DNA-binding protein [Candidatus Sedimenticola sp. (ex Thyasira tokunagai)]